MNALKTGIDVATRFKPVPAIPCSTREDRTNEDGLMKSSVVKHSVVIGGHKTSISLEAAFWNHLKEIATTQQATLSKVITQIDEARECGNLSSAIRVFVLENLRDSKQR